MNIHVARAFIFFLCITFSTMGAMAAHAAGASIAQVISITGGASVERAGQTLKLALKDALYVQDIVRTDATGKVQLMFHDDTVVSVSVNTIFSMSNFSNGADASFNAHVPSGFARFVTGTIVEKNPEAFTVRTPEVTVGIRGTTFAVQRRAEQTTVYTENSTKARSVMVSSTTIPSGYYAVFGAGATVITPPSPMSDAQRQELVSRAVITASPALSSVEWGQENPLSDLENGLGDSLDVGGSLDLGGSVTAPTLQEGILDDDDLDDDDD